MDEDYFTLKRENIMELLFNLQDRTCTLEDRLGQEPPAEDVAKQW